MIQPGFLLTPIQCLRPFVTHRCLRKSNKSQAKTILIFCSNERLRRANADIECFDSILWSWQTSAESE